jgi:hypothetical protein
MVLANWLLVLYSISSSYGFITFYQKMAFKSTSSSQTSMNAAGPKTDKRITIGSKFLPDVDRSEIEDLLKEFNITYLDPEDDPEIQQWQVSKAFFEEFGMTALLANQEKPKRSSASTPSAVVSTKKTTMDVKMAFYSNYTRPILPQYKTFIADFMSMTHIQTVDVR